MRRLLLLVVMGGAAVALTGCAAFYRAPVEPPEGFIYSSYRAPMSTHFNSNPMTSKKGEASSRNILGLVAWGDASLQAAAADGNVSKVDHVDYEFLNVLGVYSKFTTVVIGQ